MHLTMIYFMELIFLVSIQGFLNIPEKSSKKTICTFLDLYKVTSNISENSTTQFSKYMISWTFYCVGNQELFSMVMKEKIKLIRREIQKLRNTEIEKYRNHEIQKSKNLILLITSHCF